MGDSNELIMVSICCITYNQEAFIRQALDSFLMQRANFNFEVIVHDDASTDGTTDIVKEYASKFPFVIKPVFQEKNQYSVLGLNFQFKYVFPRAKGKYIAFCEGDDFWTDPLKLQKQVDFLESHQDYGLVHTKAVQFSEKEQKLKNIIGFDCGDFESLISENTISNLTVCLRNDLFKRYIEEVKPGEHKNWSTCDFPIWLWLIKQTKFMFLDEITGVYRMIDTSISHHNDNAKRLKFYEGLMEILDYYLNKNGSVTLTRKIRAKYTSVMVSMYFLERRWTGIMSAMNIFYYGKDWINMIWILITLPFYYFAFIVRGSYYIRNKLLN